MKNIPNVLVLGPITPTDEGGRLSYGRLDSAIRKHQPYDTERFSWFLSMVEGTIEEEEAARQIAMLNLLKTASKEVGALTPESRKMWAERYTTASVELYGCPVPEVTQGLLDAEVGKLRQLRGEHHINQELLERVLGVYSVGDRLGGAKAKDVALDESGETDKAPLELRRYIEKHYGHIMNGLFSESIAYSPAIIAEKFKKAIEMLADGDSTWLTWSVEKPEEKDSLSVKGGSDRKILVGAKRRSAIKDEIRGLFAHEVIVHALRSVNGSKISSELASGLPGYLDAEEGLGIYFEYAVTGVVPQKIIDRYVDISLALGFEGREPMSRNAMLEFAYAREVVRMQVNGEKIEEEVIYQKVSAHVNRIYRGTTGDEEAIGVFTKDIVYYKGFHEVSQYIRDQLETGRSIDDIIEYLLQGKFNPLDQRHISYLERATNQN